MFKLATSFAGVIAVTQALDVYANNRVFEDIEAEEDDEEMPEKLKFSFDIPEFNDFGSGAPNFPNGPSKPSFSGDGYGHNGSTQ